MKLNNTHLTRIETLRKEKKTWPEIATIFNTEGIKTRSGKAVGRNYLQHWVYSRKYMLKKRATCTTTPVTKPFMGSLNTVNAVVSSNLSRDVKLAVISKLI